jgi:hypothetical protein
VKLPHGIGVLLRIVCGLLLLAVAFGAAVLGVPTAYSWWKHSECWLRGPDSYACWEIDLLEYRPTRP